MEARACEYAVFPVCARVVWLLYFFFPVCARDFSLFLSLYLSISLSLSLSLYRLCANTYPPCPPNPVSLSLTPIFNTTLPHYVAVTARQKSHIVHLYICDKKWSHSLNVTFFFGRSLLLPLLHFHFPFLYLSFIHYIFHSLTLHMLHLHTPIIKSLLMMCVCVFVFFWEGGG